jgi:hypothetical protein
MNEYIRKMLEEPADSPDAAEESDKPFYIEPKFRFFFSIIVY